MQLICIFALYNFCNCLMLRSIIFAITFWPVFTLYIIFLYPFVYFMNRTQTYRYAFKIVSKWLMFCLKTFAKIDYRIVKKEYLYEKAPVIIGCNHQSTWETFLFSLLFNELAIVIKKELLNIPIAGLYFRRLGCIAIDRAQSVSAIKMLVSQGQKAIEKNLPILIFPNGTRSAVGEAIEYKSGIFALYKFLNVPVVNVSVDSGKFWPKRSFVKHPGIITVRCSKPIDQGLDKEQFMNELQKFSQ